MPRKLDPDSTPSMKVVQMAFFLLFSGRKYSLTDLAHKFNCSKPTVLRILCQLEGIDGLIIHSGQEGPRNQCWYWAEAPKGAPRVTLDVEAIQHLQLCRDIVYHLLPRGLREEVTNTIRNTTVLLSDFNQRSAALETFVHAYAKGTIDYTQHQDTLRALLKGMERKVVCQISYQSKRGNPPKKYLIAPMRLIAYHEGLYLRARFEEALENPGKLHDPLYSIHRILKVELTGRKFQIGKNGGELQTFGLMAGKPFRVQAAFSPAAAQYVSERKWSDDQQIHTREDGGIELEFTSTSEPEVISWILSFGPEATLLSPEPLRQTLAQKISAMAGVYDHR